MNYKLITNQLDNESRDINTLVINELKQAFKSIEQFTSRIDSICLDIAFKHNLIYNRTGIYLKFHTSNIRL